MARNASLQQLQIFKANASFILNNLRDILTVELQGVGVILKGKLEAKPSLADNTSTVQGYDCRL